MFWILSLLGSVIGEDMKMWFWAWNELKIWGDMTFGVIGIIFMLLGAIDSSSDFSGTTSFLPFFIITVTIEATQIALNFVFIDGLRNWFAESEVIDVEKVTIKETDKVKDKVESPAEPTPKTSDDIF